MGHTIARFQIRAAGRKRAKELDLLVDTGSTFTWIASRLLAELGIVPTRERSFVTIEGRNVKRSIGEAVLEYEGESATTIVVFAKEQDEQVLGVYALEGLGLEVDPGRKRLKKTRAILAV